MRTSTSGLLLLLIALLALSGFLTGNLDRWLAFLFDPNRPALSGAPAGPRASSSLAPAAPASAAPASALVSLGQTTTRVTA